MKSHGQRALERNRTVDLILTMDMLCQLSYKGVLRSVGTLAFARGFVKRRATGGQVGTRVAADWQANRLISGDGKTFLQGTRPSHPAKLPGKAIQSTQKALLPEPGADPHKQTWSAKTRRDRPKMV